LKSPYILSSDKKLKRLNPLIHLITKLGFCLENLPSK